MQMIHIHINGTFEVLLLRGGTYEATMRIAGSDSVLRGGGGTPHEAIMDALTDIDNKEN